MKLISTLPVILLLVLSSQSGVARNIFTEQTEATEAREANRKAQDNYQNLQKKIERQKALITKEQANLKEMEAKQVKAKADLDKSQAILDAKVKALEAVWDQRD